MAKQVGPIFITGTIDGIIFYKLNGQYLMRAKGSYKSGKKMRKDPRFKRTMQNADRFGQATQLVRDHYYRLLPRAVRKHGLFGELSGIVNTWLYQGMKKEDAEQALITYMQKLVPATETEAAPTPPFEKPLPVIAKPASPSSTNSTVTVSPNRKAKKARYLSHWKVKRCGRLQIPKSHPSGLIPGEEILIRTEMANNILQV